MLALIKDKIDGIRAGRIISQSRHCVVDGHMSPGVFEYWQRTAHLEFPGIPTDKVFFATAFNGLLDFFACVKRSKGPCGLPSAAADSVWHAWAARAPGNLDTFCIRYFGRTIPHIEEADMKPQMEGALVNCMVQARLLEGRDPVTPSVPALFGLDKKLRMPRGYSYELKNGAVALQRLNSEGIPHGWQRYQLGLEGVQLLSAGLISHEIYERHERMQQQNSGGSCGGGGTSSSSSSSGDCVDTSCEGGADGASSDGGGDSGGGCGGGGCGGGGCGS